MAETQGIAKINGVAIANVAKDGGVAKANIWSIGNTQRRASLFRTLTTTGNWGTYTAGKNSASFSATGDGTNASQAVYFQYDNHSAGDTYTWDFTKNATSGKVYACVVAQSNTFPADSTTSLTGFTSASAGSQNISRTINFTTSTIYIGFLLTVVSTDTLEVKDLIVTKS